MEKSTPAQPSRSDTENQSTRRLRPAIILTLVLTCQMMFILDSTVMNVALPKIHGALGFSTVGLSWVINAYTLTYGGLLLLGGRMGDLFGRRRLFIIGVAVFTAASCLGGLSTSSTWLIVARVAQGIGAAAAGPSTLALIITTFTEAGARTRALALFSGVVSSGFAAGLVLGGLLTESMTWRAVLFINVPFGIAVVALAGKFLPAPPRRDTRLDLPGAITATVGTSLLVYAFIRAAGSDWHNAITVVTLVGGLVTLGGFVVIEARAREPLMPLGLFTERSSSVGYITLFLGSMTMMGVFFFLTQFLQEVIRFDALTTGFAFLPIAAMLFVASRLVPRLIAKSGPKLIIAVGLLLMIAGLLWLTRVSTSSTYLTSLLSPMLLYGFGAGMAFTPMNIVIMSTAPPKYAGAASGVLQTMQQLGSTLGLAVLATIFGSAAGGAAGSDGSAAGQLVSGMRTAFFGATAIAIVTFVIALFFPPHGKTARSLSD